jgi:hypothetical protein
MNKADELDTVIDLMTDLAGRLEPEDYERFLKTYNHYKDMNEVDYQCSSMLSVFG